ncbi:hypothetical protein HPB48_006359 [Haemaphysalis longicornis]|uniref:Uncharacterized protein n=1 Tax=Haemaphysalis longicornis TaxID=44386 RepID=A0A9J6GBH3_HAELO|nr:hypothetical protein HPB48_006359 [Haemaphysalis longicornis]
MCSAVSSSSPHTAHITSSASSHFHLHIRVLNTPARASNSIALPGKLSEKCSLEMECLCDAYRRRGGFAMAVSAPLLVSAATTRSRSCFPLRLVSLMLFKTGRGSYQAIIIISLSDRLPHLLFLWCQKTALQR